MELLGVPDERPAPRRAVVAVLARALARIAAMAVLLGALSVVLFYLLHAMPGSPEDALLAGRPGMSQEDVERLRSLRGLDRPISARYRCWLSGRHRGGCDWWPSEAGVLDGDLGWSRVHKLPVSTLVAERAGTTLGLTVPALLLALLLAVPSGAYAATRARGPFDRAVSALSFFGTSVPVQWIGLLAILVFAVDLGWLPSGGAEDPRGGGRFVHAVLPVSVLAAFHASRFTRHVRASMLEVLGQDFVRTARAMGLSEKRVIFGHALPNALFPVLTVAAQSIPGLFSGALVTERLFAYPGMGGLIHESLVRGDHAVAMVVLLAFAALTMLATALAELAYRLLDPRLRSG